MEIWKPTKASSYETLMKLHSRHICHDCSIILEARRQSVIEVVGCRIVMTLNPHETAATAVFGSRLMTRPTQPGRCGYRVH